ncbi:type ISP restriction/modification enzyme [Herpetosiphon geysericola]|uniref:site-specific DNA-methyltransferase (adenine-specific) n=1 Tax=Herpetosiphon geysericola TaxID=70996 RepID=A0A0P6XJN0_9CHLR|nr:type ISP restriction/modification enzyme [Herpetosiphon geysericola]KPL80281.1 hypothetical protein SE18_24850 [Herpetosiphon geysericola]
MSISTFLKKVEELLQTGVATEHSYRSALEALFLSMNHDITVINEAKRVSQGSPDLIIMRQNILIGHIEAKDVGRNLHRFIKDSERLSPKTSEGLQLNRYRNGFSNLLYTDGLSWYWFIDGNLQNDEPITIGKWDDKQKKITIFSDKFTQLEAIIKHFLENTIVISSPKHLAHRLASITHWLKDIIEKEVKLQNSQGDLRQQLEAFKKTLLPKLEPEEFADMYAQTIAYGLFAARAAQPENNSFTRFYAAQSIPKTNPFLRSLFQQIAGYDLDESIAWLVDECASLLAQTNMIEVMHDFGKSTRQEDPVIHFYETFLQSYDPALKEKRGVYYTPEPVVNFIVRSVNSILQTDFNRTMGLADDNTIILDPATGTATFLYSAIQHIYQELVSHGLQGSWNRYISENLFPRIFGFELLMAPYTIAHLKLGILLKDLGYDFETSNRLGVYLTNTLADAPDLQSSFAFANKIAEEGESANEVKHMKNVMVILGNPPYSGHSSNKGVWINNLLHGKLADGTLTENYYQFEGKRLAERNSKWLQDDYVKFIRFGEWRISKTGEGILAYICNNSFLDNRTFRGMRESLLNDFDKIYILNLHGNSKKREKTPERKVDENVFDIQQGVAISIFIKKRSSSKNRATVYYADVWGKSEEKYNFLDETNFDDINWIEIDMDKNKKSYWFIPRNFNNQKEYNLMTSILEIMKNSVVGFQTHRDKLAISFSQSEMKERMKRLMDVSINDSILFDEFKLSKKSPWSLSDARMRIIENYDEGDIIPCLYRPFDIRFIYFNDYIVDRPRTELKKHVKDKENLCLLVANQMQDDMAYTHFFVSELVTIDRTFRCSRGAAIVLPLYNYENPSKPNEVSMFDKTRKSSFKLDYINIVCQKLRLTWIDDGKGDQDATLGPEDLFHYIYAIFHSAIYRDRYIEFLETDYPHIPLTTNKTLFFSLIQLGSELVDYHLLRLPGSGGVGGNGGSKKLARPKSEGLSFPIDGNNEVDVIRYNASNDEELGEVWINSNQKFIGIDQETWDMEIAGYHPLENWLKERENRTLSMNDIVHFMRMVISLKETRRIIDEIDAAIPNWPIE